MKQDWPALLPAGMHRINLNELESACLGGSYGTPRRVELFSRFLAFLERLQDIAPDCATEIWLDGSFTTIKPEPSDIDTALFIDYEKIRILPESNQHALEELLDQHTAKERYGIDLYFEDYANPHRAAYWRGVYGFCHDRSTAKGIAVLQLTP